ncbi:YidH family protein [Roseitranquillus sediminis]|uniref:YidH family protein n=1 Tax=Roseitranquillus sediminis TaxID=2809051 RepID=UPI001D0CC257|nr:DUF202 domain-containing protein [Roseitranquillus sediminis]MBM9593268.1 DUF202 domain-containing protein [Roseitranquillus sediminis]
MSEPGKKTEWAEARTDWAEDRTVLANERTFAGWMRTGLASVAVALGLHAVFRDLQPTWIAKAAASVFVIAAIYIFWTAWHNGRRTGKRVQNHEVSDQSGRRMTTLAILLSLSSLGVGAILWLL